jgi:5'-methylthioadenosine phosphorylase
MPQNFAIIGGTGFEQLPVDIYAEQLTVSTEFGDVIVQSLSDNYTEPSKLFFLSRHGAAHHIAPHSINHRANIMALKQLDVQYIMASNAVGSLCPEWAPGTLVTPHDFIDFGTTSPVTLFGDHSWSHTDFTEPYDRVLLAAIHRAAEELSVSVVPAAVYLCCRGPRFETPAEIRMFRSWGADIIGMTGAPEAVYAREAGMNYAALAVVTNLAAGLTTGVVSHEDVGVVMKQRLPVVRHLLIEAASHAAQQFGLSG